jgi:hypothetical protein
MRLLTIALLFIASLVNAQVVIDLQKLAAKQIKSTTDVTISDNSLDFKNIVRPAGYWVKFTGTYARPIVVKNLVGNSAAEKAKIIYEAVDIKTNTSTQTLKLVDCRNFDLDGTYTTKISGSGNNYGQLIDISGKWADTDVHGFKLAQNRNTASGSTTGGAMIQYHGSYTSAVNGNNWNHGRNRLWDIEGYGANDEFVYILYFSAAAQNGYPVTRAKRFEIWNTSIDLSGRDFWQLTSVDTVIIHNNKGSRGAAELEPNHVSGITLNDGVKYAEIYDNDISTVPQWIYTGTAGGIVKVWNNKFTQGEHPIRANSAAYMKSTAYFSGDVIDAPKLKYAAFTADKAQITYQGETVIAPAMFRYFNAPAAIELPSVKKTEGTITIVETTIGGRTTVQYFLPSGQELIIKP